ncbi:hypothetical protein D3C72_1595850 [compost metagenome]
MTGRRPTRLNCWNTKPMPARAARTLRLRRPFCWICWPLTLTLPCPASPATKPARWRSSVDLPDPDAPSNATISPSATCRLTLSSALAPAWNVLLKFCTSMAYVIA